MNEIKGKLKQRGGAAKGAWSHLTEGEVPTPGDLRQKRSDLAQKRDAIAREDVEKQIKKFFR